MAKPIAEFIARLEVLIGVRAADKGKLLEKLGQRAAQASGVDPVAVVAALARRESLGSTGLGGGVALPHARLPEVSTPYALLARLAAPIPFDAIDGHPVDLALLVLLPSASEADGLNALASCARRLRDTVLVDGLRQARDEAAAHILFAGQRRRDPSPVDEIACRE